MRSAAALLLVALAACGGATPDARTAFGSGGVDIVAGDGRRWSAIMDEIQTDPGSVGRNYELTVRVGDALQPCGGYTLTPDPVTAAAFTLDECESGVTRLRVVSRAALFDRGDTVSRPRKVVLRAEVHRRGDVEGGGRMPAGGSKIWYSVALRPYLYGGLRGENVTLPADRYEVRPLETHIHAAPDGAGSIARGESHLALRFKYEVVHRRTGEVVMTNEATLACADAPRDARAPAPESVGAKPSEAARERSTEEDELGTVIVRAGSARPALVTRAAKAEPTTTTDDTTQPRSGTIAVDILSMGIVLQPLADITFSSSADPSHSGLPAPARRGADLGLGTTLPGVGFTLGLSGDVGSFHGVARAGYMAGAGVPATPSCPKDCGIHRSFGELAAGPLLRLGADWGLWGGPSLRVWSLQQQTTGLGAVDFAFGAAFGLRHRWRTGRASKKHVDSFAELPIQVTVPIAGGGGWLMTTGYSFGVS